MSAGAPGAVRSEFALIVLLAAVTAIGPFTMHALSPALPVISVDFGVLAARAQLMLSLSLVAMALMTLVWGPLSDRYGRRPVLLFGLVLAAAGSVMAAMADALWIAIVGRLLQAGGGAAGMVLARAVAQDVFGGARAGDVIGKVTAVMVAAPMIAPTLAGLIVEQAGWSGIFWLSALLAGALSVWAAFGLGESAPRGHPVRGARDLIAGFAIVGKKAEFWRYTGYSACSLAAFYYFVGITPHVMRQAFDAGPAAYGLYFMLLSGTYMGTNFVAGRVSRVFGAERMLIFGAGLALFSQVLVMGMLLAGVVAPLVLFVPGMLQSFGAGLAMPHAMAGAVASTPERAGAASGFLGFCQFILASVTTQFAGFLPHEDPLVVPLGMIGLLIAGLACLVFLRPRQDA